MTPRVHVSPRGDFVAVVNDYASLGAVYDAHAVTRTLDLDGGVYCRETVPFSFAFVEHAGRTVAVHRTAWNRLDVSDAATGELLTAREPTSYTRDEPRPPHYLDYFHGRLAVSPDGSRILDDGWVWHPAGIPCVWDVRVWLDSNVWESEDGTTRLEVAVRDSYWDQAVCWLDSTRVAIGGLGDHADEIVAGARIFSAVEAAPSERLRSPSARELTSFAGPGGDFFSDGLRLFSADDEGLSVWDVEAGALTARIDDFRPTRQHRADRELVEVTSDRLRRWRY